jgi:hypothetical protein
MSSSKRITWLVFVYSVGCFNLQQAHSRPRCPYMLARALGHQKTSKAAEVAVFERGSWLDLVKEQVLGNVPGKNDKKTGLIPLWLYKKNSPHKLLEHAATLKENQFEMIVINNWTNLLLSKNGVFLLNNPGQENGTYATEIARLGPENINATLGMYFSHISAPRAAAAAISLGGPLGIVMGLVAGGPIGIMQRRSYSGYSFEINPAEAKTLNSKLSDGAGELDNEGKISFNVNDFSSATAVRVRRYLGADERILSYPYIAVETLALFLGASALNHRMSQNDDDNDEEKEKAKKTNPPRSN